MPNTEFLLVSHYVESIASQCQRFCFTFWNNLLTLLLSTALPSEGLVTPVIIILTCLLRLLKTMWAIYIDRLSWCTANIPAISWTFGPKRKAKSRNLAKQFKSQLTTKGQYILSKWIIIKLKWIMFGLGVVQNIFSPPKSPDYLINKTSPPPLKKTAPQTYSKNVNIEFV